ncbi:cytosine/adenosine deaminase [Candidatus Nitrososphaera evergladensis SR1]|uniref:Cytosine/adenosine deaminase n=1 Tax=Candidatus Nitrososphaera evergladensis SR1 TaxID=1459636 RepID=A0A075MR44_9ARCH|nr:hypothetical protein [Candidatus Nitrososphaera evergladensis]AIF83570.1 cytosine/adenosine deaminase [Candidatus Nitrososphaera evergladensis SR1]
MNRNDSGVSLLAEKCAGIATEEAEKAAARGTFGVGGLLIENSTGKVLKKVPNRVIVRDTVVDPTAHVEKQLVDWYYLSKSSLPLAADMTIICSLDPCIMCTGAILRSGLNVIRISDDSECGVSCWGQNDLTTLPAELRQEKAARFSAFGLRGNKRAFAGSQGSIFSGIEIDPLFEKRSTKAFRSSLDKIRKSINKDWIFSPDSLENPRSLAKSKPLSRVVKTIKRYNPDAFSEKHTLDRGASCTALGHVLVDKARESHRYTGLFNSACIIDPFGNILLAGGANPVEQTPLLDIMRKYHSLVNDAGKNGKRYLAHPKYCKVAIFFGPARDPTGMMEVGSLGSFFEGKLPKESRGQLEYVLPRQDASELADMLRNLPPFYSETVNLKNVIQQTQDDALKEFCKARIP